ncbi:hypothetical protein K1719_009787 [Acacia pycnantha]|nr:hypothetical protein K1719_009787 [Acacia pycnantha]
MEKLISSWYNVRAVPEDFIFPPETRPGNLHVPIGEVIPVIDLSEAEQGDRTPTIQKILRAYQEFGFFQAINHRKNDSIPGLNTQLDTKCVGACSVEVKKLALRILALISEGVRLKCEYFGNEQLSGNGVYGLQVLKKDKWIGD